MKKKTSVRKTGVGRGKAWSRKVIQSQLNGEVDVIQVWKQMGQLDEGR